ncbi:MAG: ABC transporter permease, partial [Nitrospirae bacterium]
ITIALMDSIRWRDPLQDISGSNGKTIYSPVALSLLDRVLKDLREHKEKTYSAPLAERLYTREVIELPDGRKIRDYPKLKYPKSHLLGTDKVGNDVLFLALKGVRTAVIIGGGTTLIAIPFAICFGVIAGFFGGFIDDMIQYIYTTLSSIPDVLLIVAFMLLFGPSGYQGGLITEDMLNVNIFVFNDRLFWLCLIMGITSWTSLCRLLRGETLKLREIEYIQASEALGVKKLTTLRRHIIPNVLHIVVIFFVLQFSSLVLTEAVLSYIGIGVGPEMGSWGNMISTARLELSREPIVWWNLLAAFIFMVGIVLPANILGDKVRDGLDPKLKKL